MKTWQTLGYIGLIPFIACLYLSNQEIYWQDNARLAFIAYSAVILSFIAGTLWRVNERKNNKYQQIISNAFSLIAFASLLIYQHIALAILATSYLLLFLYEKSIAAQSTLTANYITMRFRLTMTVVLLHIAASFLWFG
jgi:hypothetical protein